MNDSSSAGFSLPLPCFRSCSFASELLEEFVVGVDGFDPVVVALAVWGNGTAAAIGIAITRHGLYEIDRLVSRTVTYAVVVGLLTAVFFGMITLLTLVLPAESDLATAASTLAVAALFNPVRRRMQAVVDHRFNRSRYDAQRVIDRFAGSLRDQVDSDQVMDGWVGVVTETMQPTSVSVWVRP